MNEKIIQIGSAITDYVLTSFESEYLHSVFGGVIDVDDLVDQVILECIKKAFDDAFAKYDIILGPVAPTPAPKIGESLSDPIKMYLGDIYTISVNLAGLPGISVPCGSDSKNLPVGMQLIGDCYSEKKLIRAAYTYEQMMK